MSDYCSQSSHEAEEPLLGTASVGQRYVLISWPKRQWREKALQDPDLAEVVGWARAHDARHPGKTVVRLFAGAADPGGVEIRLFPAGVRARRVPLAEVPGWLDASFKDIDAGRVPADVEPCPRTLVVCTHGKHDRCCAKYGQAVFRALIEAAEGLGVDVVEGSHLGGHRFASTLADLAPGEPGRMYGRLRAEHVPRFVEALDEGRVWLQHYRGRVDLEPAAQIVEGMALQAGATGSIAIERLDEGRYVARWTGGSRVITVERGEFHALRKCGGPVETFRRPVPAHAP